MEPEITLLENEKHVPNLGCLGSILAFRCVLLAEHRATMI